MTYYEWYKNAGICVKCHKENATPGRTMCFDCLEKDKVKAEKWREEHHEYAKAYYARRKEIREEKKVSGICLYCRKPATHGFYCYECSIKWKRAGQKHNEKMRLNRLERGLIPEKRKTEGLCLWCGQPAIPKLNCCQKHREMFVHGGRIRRAAVLNDKFSYWGKDR